MKHSFRIVSLAVILLVAGFVASCQKPFHDENERYIFVASNINLSYWQEAQAGFMDAAGGLGVKADFTGPTFYSPEEELKAFKEAVAKNPSGILVAPTLPALFEQPIDDAIKAGIPVICIDSDAPESKRILFIGTDNYQAGVESGKQMAELLKGKGRVAIITIPGQFNLDERMRGVNEVFQQHRDIKVVATLDDKGDPRSANDLVSPLLEKKSIDGILCLEASGGPGAAEALHRLSLGGEFPVVAMDKNPETLDFIDSKMISVTIAQKPYTMAFYGLRFLDDLHHNVVHEFKDWRTAPVSPLPARVDTGTAVINSGNVAAFRAAMVAHRQPL